MTTKKIKEAGSYLKNVVYVYILMLFIIFFFFITMTGKSNFWGSIDSIENLKDFYIIATIVGSIGHILIIYFFYSAANKLQNCDY